MPTDLNIGDLVQSLTNPLHFGIIRGMLTSPNIVYLVSWFYGEENFYPPRLLTKVGNGTK
jgi:hypothetical protein